MRTTLAVLSVIAAFHFSASAALGQTFGGAVTFTSALSGLPNGAPTTVAASTVGVNIQTPVNLARGSGAAAATVAARFGASGLNATSLANAVTNNDFFTVTITPVSGGLDFTFITVAIQSDATNGPTNFAIQGTPTGFGSGAGNILTQGTLTRGSTTTLTNFNIDAVSSLYNNRTAATEFRFYVWGASTAGAVGSINNLVFAVPEPCSIGLIGLGLASLGSGAYWMRRRKIRVCEGEVADEDDETAEVIHG